MVPADWDLLQSQTRAVRLVQQLDVEPEAIDGSGIDERPAHAHAECFEAALRVPVRKGGSQSEDQVERASTPLAVRRLMRTDEAAVERSRTERDVCSFLHDLRDELG